MRPGKAVCRHLSVCERTRRRGRYVWMLEIEKQRAFLCIRFTLFNSHVSSVESDFNRLTNTSSPRHTHYDVLRCVHSPACTMNEHTKPSPRERERKEKRVSFDLMLFWMWRFVINIDTHTLTHATLFKVSKPIQFLLHLSLALESIIGVKRTKMRHNQDNGEPEQCSSVYLSERERNGSKRKYDQQQPN